jgi:protein-S-isoprenylcysteine O-methyltransferase Ste14
MPNSIRDISKKQVGVSIMNNATKASQRSPVVIVGVVLLVLGVIDIVFPSVIIGIVGLCLFSLGLVYCAIIFYREYE